MIKAPTCISQLRTASRWVGLIERAFDELAVCNQCRDESDCKPILQALAKDLESWRNPGDDNSYIAWQFKELAYHSINLATCGFCPYFKVRDRIHTALEVALGRLIIERQNLYCFLEEIKELDQ